MDKVSYWKELADYDVDTAEVMYNGGRWLYVGFMCHLVIEKTIKSYWCAKKPDDVPYIHNLLKLAQSCGLVSKMSQQQLKFLAELMPMNIEAREMKLWIESML